MATSRTSACKPTITGKKALTPPLFTWVVMSNEHGVMDTALGVFDEEGRQMAEKLAEAKRREHPDILIWVAPWPILQAALYPTAPWAEMPQDEY